MKEMLDRLLYNGSIHTLKNEADIVEALGIQDGRIVFAGTDKEAFAHYDAREAIDLGGKTVRVRHTPGHSHGSVAFIDEQDKIIEIIKSCF